MILFSHPIHLGVSSPEPPQCDQFSLQTSFLQHKSADKTKFMVFRNQPLSCGANTERGILKEKPLKLSVNIWGIHLPQYFVKQKVLLFWQGKEDMVVLSVALSYMLIN